MRQYQLQSILKKISSIYELKKKRNILLSVETFEYLFKENDVENSQVTVIEQCGVDENGILLGKDGKSFWRDSSVKSYDELYGKNYIPISTPVLIASDKNSSTDVVDVSLNSGSSLAA